MLNKSGACGSISSAAFPGRNKLLAKYLYVAVIVNCVRQVTAQTIFSICFDNMIFAPERFNCR
jgi:hypothetical protein